jgi:membrane protease YdiL (CAAX protease family)
MFCNNQGVITIILVGGIFIDWNILLMANKGDHFINRFQYWPFILIICILIIIIHEIVFRACEKKLEHEIMGVDIK